MMKKNFRPVVAYVDFASPETLSTLAQRISEALFGGIPFVDENTGIWDEVPAVRLARRVLGLSAELGGGDGSYTLQIEAPDFPWELVSDDVPAVESMDIAGYVGHLLELIPGIQLIDELIEEE